MKKIRFRITDPVKSLVLHEFNFTGWKPFSEYLSRVGFPLAECKEAVLRNWLLRDGEPPRWYNPLLYSVDVYGGVESIILKLKIDEE